MALSSLQRQRDAQQNRSQTFGSEWQDERCLVTPGLTIPIYEQSREVFYDQIKVSDCHRSSVTPHLQCNERSCHRVELLMSECESPNEHFFSTGSSRIA